MGWDPLWGVLVPTKSSHQVRQGGSHFGGLLLEQAGWAGRVCRGCQSGASGAGKADGKCQHQCPQHEAARQPGENTGTPPAPRHSVPRGSPYRSRLPWYARLQSVSAFPSHTGQALPKPLPLCQALKRVRRCGGPFRVGPWSPAVLQLSHRPTDVTAPGVKPH